MMQQTYHHFPSRCDIELRTHHQRCLAIRITQACSSLPLIYAVPLVVATDQRTQWCLGLGKLVHLEIVLLQIVACSRWQSEVCDSCLLVPSQIAAFLWQIVACSRWELEVCDSCLLFPSQNAAFLWQTEACLFQKEACLYYARMSYCDGVLNYSMAAVYHKSGVGHCVVW